MRHSTATKHPKQFGFTLMELLVATLMIGIMAAISAPGMIGFVNRSKVTSAHGELQGALNEIQREAIKRSTNCSVTLPATNSSGTFSITSNCLITGTINLNQVRIRHNLPSGNTFTFNFRGETQDSLTGGDAVIILSHQDSDNFQKCIAISRGLGLIRIGNYPSNQTTVSINSCAPIKS